MSDVFIADRLVMARLVRGQTAIELAVQAQLTPEWISSLENVRATPSAEAVVSLARALDFPISFFYRPVPEQPAEDAFHFRASSRLAKKDEGLARAISAVATEFAVWTDLEYVLPSSDIPEIQDLIESDQKVSPDDAASALRQYWGLGHAPIGNLIHLLESKGAMVFSAGGPLREIDAFSFRSGVRPFFLLNVHKSAERLRFDLAHELGHLLLHGGSLHVESGRPKEQEANDFASAFLMPKSDVLGVLRRGVSMSDVLELKSRWNVSAMALTMRIHALGITSDWLHRSLCQQLASRGFRKAEPGSSSRPERSSLLEQVMADLRSQGRSFSDIAKKLDVRTQDVRNLMVGLVSAASASDGPGSPSGRSSGHLRAVN